MIAIIDYDIGNIASVANMLHRNGIPCKISAKPSEVEEADRIILPGNGSFDACMSNLRASGLITVLERQVLHRGVPLLGICVGAQMLGYGSEEGSEPGLGWMDMYVRRFPDCLGLRVPHMGWGQVKAMQADNPLTQGIVEGTRFYFVHSYYMVPTDPADVLLTAHYGSDFAAAVNRANVTGVQFHPEKSHRFGRQFLATFAKGA